MLQKIKRKKQASKMLGESDFPGFSWPSVTEERICKVQNNYGALEENDFEQDQPQTTINPKQMQQPIEYHIPPYVPYRLLRARAIFKSIKAYLLDLRHCECSGG